MNNMLGENSNTRKLFCKQKMPQQQRPICAIKQYYTHVLISSRKTHQTAITRFSRSFSLSHSQTRETIHESALTIVSQLKWIRPAHFWRGPGPRLACVKMKMYVVPNKRRTSSPNYRNCDSSSFASSSSSSLAFLSNISMRASLGMEMTVFLLSSVFRETLQWNDSSPSISGDAITWRCTITQ